MRIPDFIPFHVRLEPDPAAAARLDGGALRLGKDFQLDAHKLLQRLAVPFLHVRGHGVDAGPEHLQQGGEEEAFEYGLEQLLFPALIDEQASRLLPEAALFPQADGEALLQAQAAGQAADLRLVADQDGHIRLRLSPAVILTARHAGIHLAERVSDLQLRQVSLQPFQSIRYHEQNLLPKSPVAGFPYAPHHLVQPLDPVQQRGGPHQRTGGILDAAWTGQLLHHPQLLLPGAEMQAEVPAVALLMDSLQNPVAPVGEGLVHEFLQIAVDGDRLPVNQDPQPLPVRIVDQFHSGDHVHPFPENGIA